MITRSVGPDALRTYDATGKSSRYYVKEHVSNERLANAVVFTTHQTEQDVMHQK